MRSALIAAAAAAALCAPAARAVDRDFKDIVRVLSDEFRAKPEHIPILGLVNAAAFVARPAAVRGIDVAIFESVEVRDIADLRGRMERIVGRGWKPFVRVASRRSGQVVLAYMRTEGSDCRLLVATVERNEVMVAQLQLNSDGLARWISSPRDAAFGAAMAAAGN